jgi:ABC-type lipoprotein export system ATPase subunit
MTDNGDLYPGQLSGGQQQRVAIARAIITSPVLILSDEPTGNLDSENTELIFELLQQIHAQGATIIMVTHAKELASRCQRRIKLRDGQITTATVDQVVGA